MELRIETVAEVTMGQLEHCVDDHIYIAGSKCLGGCKRAFCQGVVKYANLLVDTICLVCSHKTS